MGRTSIEIQNESIFGALEAAGWTRGDDPGGAFKAFNTVNGRNEATARITEGDTFNRTLQICYYSEGRNITAPDGALVPVDATSVRAAEIASAAAARAEASILESYGVRILAAQDRDDADPVLEPRF